MKPKRGTPSKLNFKKKIQLFESQASYGLTSGNIELLSQSRLGLNLANLTAGIVLTPRNTHPFFLKIGRLP